MRISHFKNILYLRKIKAARIFAILFRRATRIDPSQDMIEVIEKLLFLLSIIYSKHIYKINVK
jgi:hypothetical protein